MWKVIKKNLKKKHLTQDRAKSRKNDKMSLFATETYSNQSGGLATFSHRHHQKGPVSHGGAVLHPGPRHSTTVAQQQQSITVQQVQEQPTLIAEVQQDQSQQQLQLPQQPPQSQQQHQEHQEEQEEDQQQQQQQQQQQHSHLQSHSHQPLSHTVTTTFLSNSLLNSLNGCDVIDNKTNESIPIYIHKHQRYIMNDIFHREDERLKTFDTWPLEWMDKHQLAQTGMFYTGEDDKVKCYFCEVEIGRWEHTDHPVSEHLRWFPNCPLLRRRTTNNVPIDAEALDNVLPPLSYDICGANDSIQSQSSVRQQSNDSYLLTPASPHFISLTTTTTATTATASAVVASSQNQSCSNNNSSLSQSQAYYPEYPEYAIEAARLRSFAEWPRHMKQKPQQLAEAGFFYIGTGDRVKCFSCGGGLKDWADEDEPWEQHTLWMSKCRFLKLMKGQNYIDNVLANQQKVKDESKDESSKTTGLSDSTVIAANKVATALSTPLAAPSVLAIGTGSNSESLGSNRGAEIVGIITSTSPESVTTSLKQDAAIALSSCEGNFHKAVNTPNEKRVIAGCIPEEKLCKICYADEYNTAFLPCGHVVACAKCASSVTKCPLCRKPFTDVMRVYFS